MQLFWTSQFSYGVDGEYVMQRYDQLLDSLAFTALVFNFWMGTEWWMAPYLYIYIHTQCINRYIYIYIHIYTYSTCIKSSVSPIYLSLALSIGQLFSWRHDVYQIAEKKHLGVQKKWRTVVKSHFHDSCEQLWTY